jgi:hypothetical protein
MSAIRNGPVDDRVLDLLDSWNRAEHEWHRDMMELLDYPPMESVVDGRKRLETVREDEWIESTVVTRVTR